MKTKLLFLVLALQCVWILGTTAVQEHALRAGRLVLLETQPVDPRDFLRGDYLILAYKISDIPWSLFSPPAAKELPPGAGVFVALVPGKNQFYEVARASAEPFTPEPGQVLLRGAIGARWNNPASARVDYGLERFYVREGTGHPNGKLTVQAAVPAGGRAIIKEVFVDGVPYARAMKSSQP